MFWIIIVFAIGGPTNISVLDLVREVSMPVLFVAVACCGVAVVPVAMRIYRGWQIDDDVDSVAKITRRDRICESILLAVLLGPIFFGGPFVGGTPGVGVLAGVFGIVIGGILAISVFWLFRASSPAMFRIVLSLNLFLFVAIPGACLWLADFYRTLLLPAGSGGWFLGVAVAAIFLLLHVLLFRAMGYRMHRLPFEKSATVPEAKVVVDPFSD